MKYILQFGIILFVSFLGEILNKTIPLPVPASIYGLILMLILLKIKIIKLEKVEKTATFLIEIMPLMFIPAAVGLLASWKYLKDIWIYIIMIVVLSTLFVMVITGKVTQFVIRLEKRKKNE